MNIILKEQECEGTSKFDSDMYMTKGFMNTFGDNFVEVIFKTMDLIKKRPNTDYFQVATCDGITYWIIDDIDHITFLLPDEY